MQGEGFEILSKDITGNHKNADVEQKLYYSEGYKTIKSLAKKIMDDPYDGHTYFLLGCLLIKYFDMKETSAKVLEGGLVADPEHNMMKYMLEILQHDLSLDDFCKRLESGDRKNH